MNKFLENNKNIAQKRDTSVSLFYSLSIYYELLSIK